MAVLRPELRNPLFHVDCCCRLLPPQEYIDARAHLIKGVLLADMRDGVFNRRGFFDSPSAAASVNKNFVVFVLEGNLGKDGQPE